MYNCWIWQNLVHVMAWCLRTTGHQTSCAPVNTIDRGKKAVILQTTFSHAFPSITMCEFLSTFHLNLFSRVQCIRKRKKLFKKNVVARYLIRWNRQWNRLFFTFFSAGFSVALLVVIHKFSILNRYALFWSVYDFKANVFPAHISANQLRLQGS